MKFLNHKIVIILLFSFFLSSCSSLKHYFAGKRDISPYDYGLAEAKTGVERYNVLLETHKAAVDKGVNVNYSGIDTLLLEIPSKPSSIPLTQFNDFKGCVFVVKNTSKNCWLFRIEEKETPINVPKKLIDDGNFRSLDALKKGRYILLIEDENPWVLNRKGHEYGHQRKDILLIENGKTKNSVIMPYDNDDSSPKCSYIKVKKEPFVFKNLTIIRDEACSFLTHVAYISGFDDVNVSDVNIYTPQSTLTDDKGIRIYNCTNVTFDNVRIDGTYSQKNHSGYGINMNNVWNFKAKRLFGKGNWGIFGNNNMNTVSIEDSEINRFDIHCYGRDISFYNIDFVDLYNQYSSVFGTIRYDNCTFTNFIPIRNGGSYNAYVAHEVVFNDCVFNVTTERYNICVFSYLNDGPNSRQELTEKCFPNIRIKNMTINMVDGADKICLFRCTSSGKQVSDIGHLSNIFIDGLTIVSDGDTSVKEMALSNIDIQTKQPVDCRMINVNVVQPVSSANSSNNVILQSKMTLKGDKVVFENVKNIKQ